MAAVSVDRDKCIGCGLCTGTCPECFVMGDDNIAKAVKNECDSCDLKEIAEACPAGAIKVKE
ncbi:MAG: ferredoxin [Candidatus Altiarchaeia archaeon]